MPIRRRCYQEDRLAPVTRRNLIALHANIRLDDVFPENLSSLLRHPASCRLYRCARAPFTPTTTHDASNLKMKIIGEDLATPSSVHSNTIDALVAYLTDCEFVESQLNVGNLAMAMEYVYQPHPRFWRDFSPTFVADAVARALPDWSPTASRAPGRLQRLLRDVEETLRLNAFDEANAEMLGVLPVHERPADRASASEWICAEYRRKGQMTEWTFARSDSKRCGEYALDILACLENAKAGKPVERIGTTVARWYRESVMKQRMALH